MMTAKAAQKAVRMSKWFFGLFLSLFFISAPSRGDSYEDSVNGNLVREPALHDYHEASRAPGFSPITDVVDLNGNPVSR